MDKIVCDICGTIYPESMKNCPTCGCSRDFGLENMEEEFLDDAILGAVTEEEAEPRKKGKAIFDYDEVNPPRRSRQIPEEEDDYDDEEPEEEESGTNVGLVVVLLILIVLLLLTAGFFFVRYFLPNLSSEEETTPIVTTVPVETEPVATEEPTVPCTNLVIPGGKIELGQGGMWLMNVQVYPSNTTDTLEYVSSDESVVTVSSDGTVTAVGEGTAAIIVTCGERQIECSVLVDYTIGEETASTEELPAMEVDTGDGEETGAAEETQAVEETKAAEETQDDADASSETASTEMEVKLKVTDITIPIRYTSVTLELDCDLELSDLTWFTMDSTVAIVHDGVVTATGSGITRIYGDYGDQRVECIIRCNF